MYMPDHMIFSVEGISGSGKSYLLGELARDVSSSANFFMGEISNRSSGPKEEKILSALMWGADGFFRSGQLMTETLLLMALKTLDFEETISTKILAGMHVLEDRSVDSIAVYQATIACRENFDEALAFADQIYKFSLMWRPPPGRVFLLVDDLETSISRAEARRRMRYTTDERRLLGEVARTYLAYADRHRDRFSIIDRRLMANSTIVNLWKAELSM